MKRILIYFFLIFILNGKNITDQVEVMILSKNVGTDEEKLEEVTMELANQIVEKSPFAIKRAKKSIKLAANTSLKKGLKEEQELFVECFKSNDGKEGIKAFIDKRKPEFKGN